ncbi:phosphodiester glycosidase family protein [bacterium]|nr:phosphodiester glycosidase family protein [candidate division CSSED10-310 bacterium]
MIFQSQSAFHPVGAWLVFVCLFGCVPVWSGDRAIAPIRWNTVADGFETAEMLAIHHCRAGSNAIAAVRIDPGKWTFKTHFYKNRIPPRLMPAQQWRKQTGSVAAINAGQFDPEFRHLGWLISNGQNYGTPRHNRWKGVFAAEPIESDLPLARIIDLEESDAGGGLPPYLEAVQSLMLFDHNGKTRVKRTENQARRAVVAEDGHGRILFLVSFGQYTLWEFAALLMDSGLDLVRAMTLDGGAQAQFSIGLGTVELDIPTAQIPIPAVIVILPR